MQRRPRGSGTCADGAVAEPQVRIAFGQMDAQALQAGDGYRRAGVIDANVVGNGDHRGYRAIGMPHP